MSEQPADECLPDGALALIHSGNSASLAWKLGRLRVSFLQGDSWNLLPLCLIFTQTIQKQVARLDLTCRHLGEESEIFNIWCNMAWRRHGQAMAWGPNAAR